MTKKKEPPDDDDTPTAAAKAASSPATQKRKKAAPPPRKAAPPKKRKKKEEEDGGDGEGQPAGTKNKRKRATTATTKAGSKGRGSSPKKAKTTSAAAAAVAATATVLPPPPPTKVLIVDNGGDTIKYGWNDTADADDADDADAGDDADGAATKPPRRMPNVTARLQQQWTVLAGDELADKMLRNPSQHVAGGADGLRRSVAERGCVTDLGNQIQVWKRMLDLLNVDVPLRTLTALALGWKATGGATTATQKGGGKASTAKGKKNATAAEKSCTQDNTPTTTIVSPSACAVLLAVPPHCPRVLLDAIAEVWFDDFGFARVGFVAAPLCAALVLKQQQPPAATADDVDGDCRARCVVDVGWSAIHSCPTFRGKAILSPSTVAPPPAPVSSAGGGGEGEEVAATASATPPTTTTTIRRIPIGGRHLVSVWKYWTTYRQWNLMEQEWILRDVLEKTGYVSRDFGAEMRLARTLPGGRRPYDREYVLPDFQTTLEGRVRLPPALLRAAAADDDEKKQQEEDEDEDDEDDSDYGEEDMMKEAAKDDEGEDEEDYGNNDDDDEEVDEDDDEEETADEIKRRVLQQRAEEDRRRREQENEQQVLNLSTERFAVPEILFRPSDAGLPADWAGLPAAIVQSIEACPRSLQPALYRSVHLVGGLSQLPGLRDRLLDELRALAPCEYEVEVTDSSSDSSPSSPMDQAWLGARQLTREEDCSKWSATRQEWESPTTSASQQQRRSSWKRFEVSQGGYLV